MDTSSTGRKLELADLLMLNCIARRASSREFINGVIIGARVEQNRFSDGHINLANPRLGAKAIFATNNFFAACERVSNSEPVVFGPGTGYSPLQRLLSGSGFDIR